MSTTPLTEDGAPILLIPPYRTRLMMKSSPDVDSVSVDSVVCLSKATELFVRELVLAAFSSDDSCTYEDLSNLQRSNPRYTFLADVLPTKITGMDWLKKYKADFDASCSQ